MKGSSTQIKVTTSSSSETSTTSFRTRLQERRSSSSTRAHLSLPLNASPSKKTLSSSSSASNCPSPSFYGPSLAALVAASCPSTAAATPTGLGPAPLAHPVLNLLKVSLPAPPTHSSTEFIINFLENLILLFTQRDFMVPRRCSRVQHQHRKSMMAATSPTLTARCQSPMSQGSPLDSPRNMSPSQQFAFAPIKK